jgi:uncharacterized protein (TIGR04255 family)
MPNAICYRRTYLTEVIVRVDLASPIAELERRLDPRVRQAATKYFPIPEPRKVLARQIQASDQAVKASQSAFTEWHFHGKERDKTVVIAPAVVLAVYKAYESYEALHREFLELTSAFFEAYGDTQANRLGLRYINNVTIGEGDLLDWSRYINSDMLCFLRFCRDSTITRALGLLEFAFDDFGLTFQYGMHNPDHPAPIRRKVFVLDLDAYQAGPLEASEIALSLDKFHGRVQELFERSITDELRAIMNAKD